MRFALPWPAAALLAALPHSVAQTPAVAEPAAARERLAERCQRALDAFHGRADFPGGSAALVLPDGTELTFTVGRASVEDGTPMRATDRLLAGSVGKTFVAAALLRLACREKLSLDDRAAEHLGDHAWFARLPNADTMTLRHLLRHQSGLPRYVLDPRLWRELVESPDRTWKPEELLAFVLDADPVHAAGAGFAYSDTGYLVAGLILERVAEAPFYDHVREHLLEPHRLADTVPSDRRRIEGLAQGYGRLFASLGVAGPVLEDGVFVINPQFEWCGGGFATTPLDLARWARILYSGAAFDGDYLEAALDGVPADALGKGTRYGPGVMIRKTEEGTLLGHDGVFPGYRSTMGWFPEHRIAAAFQVNTDDPRSRAPLHALLVELAGIARGELARGR